MTVLKGLNWIFIRERGTRLLGTRLHVPYTILTASLTPLQQVKQSLTFSPPPEVKFPEESKEPRWAVIPASSLAHSGS